MMEGGGRLLSLGDWVMGMAVLSAPVVCVVAAGVWVAVAVMCGGMVQ